MRTYISIILLIALNCFGADWNARVDSYCGTKTDMRSYVIYSADNGMNVGRWNIAHTNKPTIQQLIDQDAAIATKKAQEQAAKDALLVIRHRYENGYFLLVKSVLTLANDPRKDVTPIPKLSFDELDSILAVLYEDNNTNKKATKLAMKLLSVNSALIRYDINWWNEAIWHSDI